MRIHDLFRGSLADIRQTLFGYGLMHTYQSLEKFLGLEKELPVAENWSAAADFLELISNYCLQHKPQTIVECSSGTSSLVLSRCCQLNGQGQVYSLENGHDFASQTRRQLDDFELADYCHVLHTPLQEYLLDGRKFQWYDLTNLYASGIDLLVIDGPPGFLQKYSRFPALPLLSSFMAEQCMVFLDDAAREDEQEIVRCWLQQHPEFEAEYIENERGCSVLMRR